MNLFQFLPRSNAEWNKKILMMKLICFYMIAFLFQGQASTLAQSKKVTLDFYSVEIQEVFTEIQKQTDLTFLYPNEDLTGKEIVSISVDEEPVENALALILTPLDLEFKIANSYIIVRQQEQQTSAQVITGQVTDENGDPLVGASVYVKGNRTIGTVTDNDGNFSLDVEPPFTLVVSFVGFQTYTVEVSDGQENIVIQMLQSFNELEGVTVSTTRLNQRLEDIPHKMEMIGSKNISQAGSIDAAEVLKANGFAILESSMGTSQVQVRGFNSGNQGGYVLLLLDGRPTGYDDLSQIPSYNIERIEVIKGPAAVQYGSSAMGGVINFITKKSKGDISGNAGIYYGSFDSYGVNASVGGGISDKTRFNLGVSYKTRKGDFKTGKNNFFSVDNEELIGPSGTDVPDSDRENVSINGGLGFELGNNWNLDLLGEFYADDRMDFLRGLTPNPSQGKSNRSSFDIDLKGNPGKHNLRFRPYFFNRSFESLRVDPMSPSMSRYKASDRISKILGLQAQDAITLAQKHQVVFGIDYQNIRFELEDFNPDGSNRSTFGPNEINTIFATFVNGSFHFLKSRFIATVGGRFTSTTFTPETSDFFQGEIRESEKR